MEVDELLVIDGVDEDTAAELQARARDFIDAQNAKALENVPCELGAEDSLIEFEGLTPQMVEALAKDDVKTLEDFATCADWELAGGWTVVDGERQKDDGVLEPFDVSLEEAQTMVMTARIQLGWVDPDDLIAQAEEEGEETAEGGRRCRGGRAPDFRRPDAPLIRGGLAKLRPTPLNGGASPPVRLLRKRG